MSLYQYAGAFEQLFDDFDAICSSVPDTNENGEYIDDDGNVIPDLTAYRQTLQQAWFDTLDGIEQEFEYKAENIAAYIKSLKAEADSLKAEEAALSRRRKAKENQLESLKHYLLDNMQAIGRTRIDRPKARISIRSNAESVRFDDENEFIMLCQRIGMDDFLRYKLPEINKTAVRQSLQSGVHIEGASLVRTQSLLIK